MHQLYIQETVQICVLYKVLLYDCVESLVAVMVKHYSMPPEIWLPGLYCENGLLFAQW